MNLSLLILLPVVTALGVLMVRDAKQVRVVALMGAVAQLVLCGFLLMDYSPGAWARTTALSDWV